MFVVIQDLLVGPCGFIKLHFEIDNIHDKYIKPDLDLWTGFCT